MYSMILVQIDPVLFFGGRKYRSVETVSSTVLRLPLIVNLQIYS